MREYEGSRSNKPSVKRNTAGYYQGQSGYGSGSQAGSVTPKKPKDKPSRPAGTVTRNTAGYYQGQSGYGSGPQAGVSGNKKTPKKDEKKPGTRKSLEFWGKGQSGYGSGPIKGSGGTSKAVQNAASRRADNGPYIGTSIKNQKTISQQYRNADRDRILKEHASRKGTGHDVGRELTKSNKKSFATYREMRKATGDYKGKYYGPDVFKGDIDKLSRWRAAGSPKNKKRFA